jgi:hypothetical protein
VYKSLIWNGREERGPTGHKEKAIWKEDKQGREYAKEWIRKKRNVCAWG